MRHVFNMGIGCAIVVAESSPGELLVLKEARVSSRNHIGEIAPAMIDYEEFKWIN